MYIKLSANVQKASKASSLSSSSLPGLLLLSKTHFNSSHLISEKSAGTNGEICRKHARQRSCEYFCLLQIGGGNFEIENVAESNDRYIFMIMSIVQ